MWSTRRGTQPGSPIYGMPILNVDEAQTVRHVAEAQHGQWFRCASTTPLFYDPKTLMYFGNTRRVSVAGLLQAVKEQG